MFNTLLGDKATKDRLRSYPHWLASRNLANEASDESVEALIEAVQSRYDLARRWYALKARLLGLDRLAHYDRMAPVSDSDERIPYGEAREIVLDCYRSFSPELGDTAAAFFEHGHIDGPPRPGKRGGAFCSYTVPSAHPYVLLNYSSRPYDVLTMAHELGHGVHASLARPQGIFHFTTPLTLAETASIFGETIVLERLLERAPGAGGAARPARRRARRRRRRGVPAGRDEPLRARAPHDAPRGRASCRSTASPSCGSRRRPTCSATASSSTTTTASGGRTSGTSSTRPATSTRTRTAICSRCRSTAATRRRASRSCPSYLDLLRAGGSRPPEELGAIVGVDLADPGFWASGLELIERQLDAAEQARRRPAPGPRQPARPAAEGSPQE